MLGLFLRVLFGGVVALSFGLFAEGLRAPEGWGLVRVGSLFGVLHRAVGGLNGFADRFPCADYVFGHSILVVLVFNG